MSTRAGYAVIWDVDGVLIDSAEQHRQAWHALARENGFRYTDADFWETFGMRNGDIIPRVFDVSDLARVSALGQHKENIYRDLLAKEAVALPGAVALMA